MDIPDEPPGGSRRASRRGSDGFASPSITSNRSRRKAKPLEEEAMENIHAFFQSVENHLESMSVAEQQEATFLLAQLDSLAPPNWNRHWRDNLQQSLRTVESCYDDFFSCGGKCTLWPNGLRNGLTPTRTQPVSRVKRESTDDLPNTRAANLNLVPAAPAAPRARRPPLPAPPTSTPIWTYSRKPDVLVLYQNPYPTYVIHKSTDRIVSSVETELNAARVVIALAENSPVKQESNETHFISERIASIARSRKAVSEENSHAATSHLDNDSFGSGHTSVAIQYLQMLDAAMAKLNVVDAKLLVVVQRDALPGWMHSIRREWPDVRPILLSFDSSDAIFRFNLLSIQAQQRLPLLYIASEEFVSTDAFSAEIWDTIVLDDADRIPGSKYLQHHFTKAKCFHKIGLSGVPGAAASLKDTFPSVWHPSNQKNIAGGCLRTNIIFCDLLAEKEAYNQLATQIDAGFDQTKKPKDLLDAVYTFQNGVLCTIFSMVGPIVAELVRLRQPGDAAILVVCSKPQSVDDISDAFEGLFGPGTVLCLNGHGVATTNAGTNYHALEHLPSNCKVIVTRSVIAEKQLSNLYRHVSTIIFVEAPIHAKIVHNMFTVNQSRQCLVLAVEPANTLGLLHVEQALATATETPKRDARPWSAAFKGTRFTAHTLKNALHEIIARQPSNSLIETLKATLGDVPEPSAEIKEEPRTQPSSQEPPPVPMLVTAASLFDQESPRLSQAYFAAKIVEIEQEKAQKEERAKNRKKRPAPGDLAYPAAKRAKTMQISAERFTQDHVKMHAWNAQRMMRYHNGHLDRKLMVLIQVSAEAAPNAAEDLAGSNARSIAEDPRCAWLDALLTQVDSKFTYEIVDLVSTTMRQTSYWLFVVALNKQNSAQTREQWLKAAQQHFLTMSEENFVELATYFEIEITADGISDISFADSDVDASGAMDLDVEYGDDDVEFAPDLSSATSVSMTSNRRLNGSRRTVSPTRRAPARRTSFGEDDVSSDHLADLNDSSRDEMDVDPVAEHEQQPVASSALEQEPSQQAAHPQSVPSSSAAIENVEPTKSSCSSSSALAAAPAQPSEVPVAAPAPVPTSPAPEVQPAPPPQANPNNIQGLKLPAGAGPCLQKVSQSRADWLKVLKFLVSARIEIYPSDLKEIVKLFFNSNELLEASQLVAQLMKPPLSGEPTTIADELARFSPSPADWLLVLRFLEASKFKISANRIRTVIELFWKDVDPLDAAALAMCGEASAAVAALSE